MRRKERRGAEGKGGKERGKGRGVEEKEGREGKGKDLKGYWLTAPCSKS